MDPIYLTVTIHLLFIFYCNHSFQICYGIVSFVSVGHIQNDLNTLIFNTLFPWFSSYCYCYSNTLIFLSFMVTAQYKKAIEKPTEFSTECKSVGKLRRLFDGFLTKAHPSEIRRKFLLRRKISDGNGHTRRTFVRKCER